MHYTGISILQKAQPLALEPHIHLEVLSIFLRIQLEPWPTEGAEKSKFVSINIVIPCTLNMEVQIHGLDDYSLYCFPFEFIW